VLVAVGLLVAGFATLLVAGDLLVRASGRLALRLGLSPVVIGATVVAFGTSTPELSVSMVSALRGSDGVAAGNVIGSNIANILLVLGLAATIAPMAVHRRIVRFDIPVVIGVTIWVLLVLANGHVSRIEGVVSALALGVLIVVQLKWFASDGAADVPELEGVPFPVDDEAPRMAREVGLAALAIGALVGGSSLFVSGATSIARDFGVSEFAIGATVVAVGTSLPELVTSAIAAWKREHDIAIGNVLGSNLFNILAVLGLTAAVRPISVDRSLFEFELPVLLVSTVVLAPLVIRNEQIGRSEGLLFLIGFVAYTAVTLVRGG
jgi:cation:H+ antiporter